WISPSSAIARGRYWLDSCRAAMHGARFLFVRPATAPAREAAASSGALVVLFAMLGAVPVAAQLSDLVASTPGRATGGGQVAGELAEMSILRGASAGGVLVNGNVQVHEGEPGGEARPFRVGAAKRTLNPTVAVAPPDGQVYLGGYGLGAVRRSTGVLGSGAWVRAFVVDNGAQAVALVESDNQGAFAAYEPGRGAVGAI